MFSGMYFQKDSKVDSKNRIFIPSESKITQAEEIAVAKMPDYYELFWLKRIQELVDNLESRFHDVPKSQRDEILKDLNYIFSVIVRTSKVDAQRRITMPSQDFYPGQNIVLQGRGNSIAVFDSTQRYEEYMSHIRPSGILR